MKGRRERQIKDTIDMPPDFQRVIRAVCNSVEIEEDELFNEKRSSIASLGRMILFTILLQRGYTHAYIAHMSGFDDSAVYRATMRFRKLQKAKDPATRFHMIDTETRLKNA